MALGYDLVSSLSKFLFVILQMNLNPWAGCEGYAECEQALDQNGRQVLFKCRHGKYWYLGDRVLPQVEHVYPPTTIPTPPCLIVRLAKLLADEEIARACDGYIVARVKGNYSEFVRDHLQSCLVDRMVFLFPSNFCSTHSFSRFLLGNKFVCWIFSLHLLNERKRFPLLTMLVVLLVLS